MGGEQGCGHGWWGGDGQQLPEQLPAVARGLGLVGLMAEWLLGTGRAAVAAATDEQMLS